MSSDYKELPLTTAEAIDTVATVLDLPDDAVAGDIRYVLSTDKLYTYDGSSWVAGAGMVEGPGSSTDNAIPRFNGTGGATLQGSTAVIDDSGNMTVTGYVRTDTANNTPGFILQNHSGPQLSLQAYEGVKLEFATSGPFFQFADLSDGRASLLARANKDLYLAPDGSNASRSVVIAGSSGQTAKLLDVQLSDGTSVFSVAANGSVTIVTTTGAFTPPKMTSTQRDNLTAVKGMMIYNTTTDKFQGYDGAWVDLN